MIKSVILLAVFFLSLTDHAPTSERKQVESTIRRLFEGMARADSASVRAVFEPGALMGSIVVNAEGKPVFRSQKDAVDGFVRAVGSPHSEIWDERLTGLKIVVDGNMASARVPYQFYRGEVFSHCGVNQFILMKTAGEWRIVSVVDTRHRRPCPK